MDVEPEEEEKLSSRYPTFLWKWKWFRDYVKENIVSEDFPDFVSKTDEDRIQNVPERLKSDCLWVATEKVDGQSGTFTLRKKS